MKARDLDMNRLLHAAPHGGALRFAGRRAVLVEISAIAQLRNALVEVLGLSNATSAISKMGFLVGWRLACAVEDGELFEDPADRRSALPRLGALLGLFEAEPCDPFGNGGVIVRHSAEVEGALGDSARADSPVCHAVAGLMSGYLSRVSGKRVEVVESRCAACGHDACEFRVCSSKEAQHDDETLGRGSFLNDTLDTMVASLLAVDAKPSVGSPSPGSARATRLAAGGSVEDSMQVDSGITAYSAKMKEVLRLASLVAPVDASILISGETGVGKEGLARFIHQVSGRKGSFIAVNCGAITETLFESELFGHARGAFTGASQDRPGLFEAAQHGTLLLDEVGEVSPAMQVKLLRVLQQQEVRRVGENQSRPIDVRVISATNQDLMSQQEGLGFRQDLYYRIKVVELSIPPLRHRHDDILPLARLFLERAAARMGRSFDGVTPDAADLLLQYSWPGNVRELENVMERAAALSQRERIESQDLPVEVLERSPPEPVDHGAAVQPLEVVFRKCIMDAMAINGGNQRITAAQLGISAATLYRRLKRYGQIDHS